MRPPYDFQYEEALSNVLSRGANRGDRTGVGTRGLFGIHLRWWLPNGLPLITTKKVFTRGVIEELLWMLSGSTNNNDLLAKNIHIWDEWARPDGGLGPIYGKQWRSWSNHNNLGQPTVIDQISWVVNEIKTNPSSRRLVVSAWNVADLKDMALAPCHCLFQFYVDDEYLSCQLYQRSADMFLGVPFNIASYAMLTHMVAQQCELRPGEFIWAGGDCHIYNNHLDQVREQLNRNGTSYPQLELKQAADIFSYQLSDFAITGYDPQPAIHGEVAV